MDGPGGPLLGGTRFSLYQRHLVKSHFIRHPSLPRHNSPENRVSGARRATPQDSSQVFHKTAVAPSSGQHEPGQFSRFSRSTSSKMTSFRTVVAHAHSPAPRLIFPVPIHWGPPKKAFHYRHGVASTSLWQIKRHIFCAVYCVSSYLVDALQRVTYYNSKCECLTAPPL